MFGTLKNAYDLAKDLTALQVSTEFKTKINDLLAALFAAREEAMTLQEESVALKTAARELEAKLAKRTAWNTEKEKYELKEIRKGNFACVLKSGSASAPHYCQNCFESERKSPLQIRRLTTLVDYKCPSCGAQFGGLD